ncbi:hypothetical protein O6H91_Y495000 [Diphasiastrum complanatum]|nr:hypothetical protein O6H91_Y495000 [Diphasiastrum complanatum]
MRGQARPCNLRADRAGRGARVPTPASLAGGATGASGSQRASPIPLAIVGPGAGASSRWRQRFPVRALGTTSTRRSWCQQLLGGFGATGVDGLGGVTSLGAHAHASACPHSRTCKQCA